MPDEFHPYRVRPGMTAKEGISKNNFTLRSFVAGGLAGCLAKSAVAPFDRVKIHFQVKSPSFQTYIGILCLIKTSCYDAVGQYAGVFQAISLTYRKEGVVGLYRGHLATIARVFPYAAINFTTFEYLKQYLCISQNSRDAKSAMKRILAGSLSGCTAVTFTYPFDILRARIAYLGCEIVKGKSSSGIYNVAAKMLWNEGVKNSKFGLSGFYQGYLPTILGIIPYAGTSFFTFETLKSFYASKYPDSGIAPLVKLSLGMIAGAVAQTIAYPFDVVRRRSQIWQAASHLPESKSSSLRQTYNLVLKIIRDHGFKELFTGMSINYLKVIPSMGISFMMYEILKEKLPL